MSGKDGKRTVKAKGTGMVVLLLAVLIAAALLFSGLHTRERILQNERVIESLEEQLKEEQARAESLASVQGRVPELKEEVGSG
ncbi:MAG: hypothetical protein K6E30_11045 [Lachnospiraceae bacterium]|nr:hypothetical protein [Lachnospiraceae bacterium]